MAYEGTRGYQPLVAVWAEEQLIVADEFRDGNVAGGEDPLSSARQAMENLPPWVRERYFRGDSASDDAPLLKYLVSEGIGFTISADLTKELRACCWWCRANSGWSWSTAGASRWRSPQSWSSRPGTGPGKRSRCATWQCGSRRGTELFDTLTPKHLAIVSNRAQVEAGDLVRWHWEKAGTIEHVHRV